MAPADSCTFVSVVFDFRNTFDYTKIHKTEAANPRKPNIHFDLKTPTINRVCLFDHRATIETKNNINNEMKTNSVTMDIRGEIKNETDNLQTYSHLKTEKLDETKWLNVGVFLLFIQLTDLIDSHD